ncbi:hypothetical protein [Rosenbergiella epipactidis]|uniref:hypothetical protein n=1 Tax=Rosenbergiella epipactidis TaxID=1544694 RepID=UPI001F4EBDF5|nr:hypothetical protein [Rosenbergiella epipactidis]
MNFSKKYMLTIGLLSFTGFSVAATPTMNWKIPSPEPVNQITFGITINAAAPVDEFYFANQFGFTGGGGIGYTGIQPTKNTKDGKRQFMVLFSSFRKDTTTNYKNCKGGADGAKAGATCRLYIPGELGDTFLFKVKKDGQLLTGTAVNTTTGREDIIGEWKVGETAGNLAVSQISWIENYKMNNSSYHLTCDNKGWPYYEVKFLPPTGNNGKFKGTISTLSKGSDACPGAITWTHDGTGTLVKGGFK